jgi:hypothetical protein
MLEYAEVLNASEQIDKLWWIIPHPTHPSGTDSLYEAEGSTHASYIWVQTQSFRHHGIIRFILDSLLFSVINSVAKFTVGSNVQAA